MELFPFFVKHQISALLFIILDCIILFSYFNGFSFLGVSLFILGAFIYFWNKREMGKVWTIRVEKKNKLVSSGLFKYIRHPLYLGGMIMSFSLIFFVKNKLFLLFFNVLIAVPFFYYRARLEEKLLSKTLKGYKSYMKRTKMFIPFLF